jgi:putative component of toxin-antitoxin plasmid stabilization module
MAEAGNLGDWKSLGAEVSEMRVDVGPVIGFISRAGPIY